MPTPRSAVRARPRVAALVLVALSTSGCVVGEIRDEMVDANTGLSRTDEQLRTLDASLQSAIERVDERLDQVTEQAARLERTNALLEQITVSLQHIDEHLRALRTILETIDDTIPFLDLGTEKVPTPEGGTPTPDDPPPADGGG